MARFFSFFCVLASILLLTEGSTPDVDTENNTSTNFKLLEKRQGKLGKRLMLCFKHYNTIPEGNSCNRADISEAIRKMKKIVKKMEETNELAPFTVYEDLLWNLCRNENHKCIDGKCPPCDFDSCTNNPRLPGACKKEYKDIEDKNSGPGASGSKSSHHYWSIIFIWLAVFSTFHYTRALL